MHTKGLFQDCIRTLTLVLDGKIHRDDASMWASKILFNDDILIEDDKLIELLDIISGIDSKIGPHEPYLHDEQQIKDWINQFNT